MSKNSRNFVNIFILFISPFVIILFEEYITKLSDKLMIFKNEPGFRLIISALPLLNGIIIGLFILLVLFISKKIEKQFKYGFVFCFLCLIVYPIWYVLIWLFSIQLYSFSKYLMIISSTENIDLIVTAIVLIVFQHITTKKGTDKVQ